MIEFSEGGDEEERGDVGGDKRHNHCARLTHDKVNIERKMDLEIVDRVLAWFCNMVVTCFCTYFEHQENFAFVFIKPAR